MVDDATIAEFIKSTFAGLDIVEIPNTIFFFYDPRRELSHDRRQPFATIVKSDEHDRASDLDRPGVFRLNIGVSRESYRSMFGPEPAWNLQGGPVDTGHDFTALDTFLPHPVYAPMSWICILDPSAQSWERAQVMLHEAYSLAAHRHAKSAKA